MPIAPFPHEYSVTLANDQIRAEHRPAFPIGSPPQFGGTDDVWSPEDLLVAATLTCLKTTFDAYARHAQLAVHGWRGGGTGVLVKGREGPIFDRIDLDVAVETEPGDEERARELLGKAERQCIITRALNAPVHLTATVTAARAAS